MTLEEALASPTYPPAEASLALLAFLRDELPLGGTAAEARLIRLFPLLVSRIVGGLNAADGHRHEPGGGSAGGSGGLRRRPTERAAAEAARPGPARAPPPQRRGRDSS